MNRNNHVVTRTHNRKYMQHYFSVTQANIASLSSAPKHILAQKKTDLMIYKAWNAAVLHKKNKQSLCTRKGANLVAVYSVEGIIQLIIRTNGFSITALSRVPQWSIQWSQSLFHKPGRLEHNALRMLHSLLRVKNFSHQINRMWCNARHKPFRVPLW